MLRAPSDPASRPPLWIAPLSEPITVPDGIFCTRTSSSAPASNAKPVCMGDTTTTLNTKYFDGKEKIGVRRCYLLRDDATLVQPAPCRVRRPNGPLPARRSTRGYLPEISTTGLGRGKFLVCTASHQSDGPLRWDGDGHGVAIRLEAKRSCGEVETHEVGR